MHKARFIDAKHGQCMFFLPGQSGMEGFVCGAPTIGEKSFCGCHHKATHQPPKRARYNYRIVDRSIQIVTVGFEREPDLTEMMS
ncbi:hypothetical protein [Bradyrhizobium sp. LeoA1S1]